MGFVAGPGIKAEGGIFLEPGTWIEAESFIDLEAEEERCHAVGGSCENATFDRGVTAGGAGGGTFEECSCDVVVVRGLPCDVMVSFTAILPEVPPPVFFFFICLSRPSFSSRALCLCLISSTFVSQFSETLLVARHRISSSFSSCSTRHFSKAQSREFGQTASEITMMGAALESGEGSSLMSMPARGPIESRRNEAMRSSTVARCEKSAVFVSEGRAENDTGGAYKGYEPE